MQPFDFVFAVFALVLGLALAEVLAGLARVVRAEPPVRLGWPTPLLGLLVMIDLTTFWAGAWEARQADPAIGPNYLTLMIGLAVTGTYYLAASLVFPHDLKQWADLDVHYARHTKQVLAAVAACNALAYAAVGAVTDEPWPPERIAIVAAFFAGLLAAMLLEGPKASAAVLAGLLALYPLSAVLGRNAGGAMEGADKR